MFTQIVADIETTMPALSRVCRNNDEGKCSVLWKIYCGFECISQAPGL